MVSFPSWWSLCNDHWFPWSLLMINVVPVQGSPPIWQCWRIQKVGKDTAITEHFSFPVGNIDHLSYLVKWNIPSKVEFANTIKTAVKAWGARTGKSRYSIYHSPSFCVQDSQPSPYRSYKKRSHKKYSSDDKYELLVHTPFLSARVQHWIAICYTDNSILLYFYQLKNGKWPFLSLLVGCRSWQDRPAQWSCECCVQGLLSALPGLLQVASGEYSMHPWSQMGDTRAKFKGDFQRKSRPFCRQ